jgi:toxin ParE1/3/4
MQRRLKVTATAQRDLLEIWSFIEPDNANAADKLLTTITKQLDKLLRFPELGRQRNELVPPLRSIAVKNYVIFYQLTDKYVEIVRVLHGARDIKRIFADA